MKNIKRITKIFIIILAVILVVLLGIMIFLFGFGGNGKVENATTTDRNVGLHVEGTQIKTVDGSTLVLRGINHAHCWYQDEDEIAFDGIEATGANCIRIVLADGGQWDRDTEESVQYVIEAARTRGMVAIIEVHDGTGIDDAETLEKIADFWVEMADVLKGTEDYCIVNIANEWYGSYGGKKWAEAYETVIPEIRDAGISNLLMVDAAGWGQYGRCIRTNGVNVFEADPLKNTMFSIHMYGMSGRYNWLIRYNLNGARKHNLCVCVGEFGYKHSDGDVREDYLMQYCTENNIGYLAWSWKGNSGGVEYLDLSNDWEGNNLTTDWGENVVNGRYGIRATSVKIPLD